jgi:predicted nucleic acid-binding protein
LRRKLREEHFNVLFLLALQLMVREAVGEEIRVLTKENLDCATSASKIIETLKKVSMDSFQMLIAITFTNAAVQDAKRTKSESCITNKMQSRGKS